LSLNDKNETIYTSYFCKTTYDYNILRQYFIDKILKYSMSIQIKEWINNTDDLNEIYFTVFCNKKIYKEFLIEMSNIESKDLQFWFNFLLATD